MNRIHLLTISIVLLVSSCSDKPQRTLLESKKKVQGSQSLSYKQLALYPNPIGKIDTLASSVIYSKTDEHQIGYDFLSKSEYLDEIYINGDHKIADHKDNIVKFQIKANENFRSNNIDFSPITFLDQNWKFVKDTLIDNNEFLDFFQVENDTLINGNKIYTERHIFINTLSKLIDRFERRNYFKGKLSQTVTYLYSDYDLSNLNTKLNYDFPSGYKSIPFGKNNNDIQLKVGQKAPEFTASDLENNQFDLNNYRGKKVLLNFSTINCGYCKLALEHFNQKDYQLSNNVNGIYINYDKKTDVLAYTNKIEVPFPVLSDGKELAKLYGVSVYPTFFLIDEEGIIEKIVLGYQKGFIDSLSKL